MNLIIIAYMIISFSDGIASYDVSFMQQLNVNDSTHIKFLIIIIMSKNILMIINFEHIIMSVVLFLCLAMRFMKTDGVL